VKILLAVDGSHYSEITVKVLKTLSLPGTTEVTMMTVVPDYVFLGNITLPILSSTVTDRKQVRKAQERKANKILRDIGKELESTELSINPVVRWGKPAEQIVNEVRNIQADLVIIGAKGMTDSPQFSMGSVAQKVTKYSNADVLLVREGSPNLKRVILATDGSRYSHAAVQSLLGLPLPRQAHVFLVTVIQSCMAALIKTPTLDLEANRQILEELQKREEDTARSLLENTEINFRKKGYRVSSLILRGEPAEEMLKAAESISPELIVVGAKGLTGIKAFLLGSVSQRVARYSHCSVLIARKPATSIEIDPV